MKNDALPTPINVLVLEDRVSDAELMMAQLREAGFAVTWRRVETEPEYTDHLKADLDLIVADYQLPQFDAIRALQLLRARNLDIPFILVSGKVGDDFIVEAMKQGAADFLLKDRMARFGIAIEQALERRRLRMSQRDSEHKLREAMVESERNRTELQVANHALAGKNEQLSELYQTAQRFMDDVSHEFRTPLSVIKGYSELMCAGVVGTLSPEQNRFSQIIIDRARDMAQMVDDLLDSSKLRAGSLRVDRKPCEIAGILAALHPIIDSRVAASHIEWVEQIDADLPQVFADAEKVTRVLVNLVINAIKFSPEGSRIIFSATATRHGDIQISVADQGPGISAENLAVIFQRFKQVGNASASTKGFGLGLNIARELVALNLGEISVASTLEKGSIFSFTLPLNDPKILLTRLLKRLELLSTPPGALAILRVVPRQTHGPHRTTDVLRGYLASSSHPGDLIMSSMNGEDLLLVGYSEKPTHWHQRLVTAGRSIEQFTPTQKLCAFEVELVDTLPYPAPPHELISTILKHLHQEPLHV
jgi:signal transduction histidine kinase